MTLAEQVVLSKPVRLAWTLAKALVMAALMSLVFAKVGGFFWGPEGLWWGWVSGAVVGFICGPRTAIFGDAGGSGQVVPLGEALSRVTPTFLFSLGVFAAAGFLSGALGVVIVALIHSPWGNLTPVSPVFGAYLIMYGMPAGAIAGLPVGILWHVTRARTRPG